MLINPQVKIRADINSRTKRQAEYIAIYVFVRTRKTNMIYSKYGIQYRLFLVLEDGKRWGKSSNDIKPASSLKLKKLIIDIRL